MLLFTALPLPTHSDTWGGEAVEPLGRGVNYRGQVCGGSTLGPGSTCSLFPDLS